MDVASLALGIAGLTGQTMAGITALKSFFSDYKQAHVKVSTLDFELESLLSTLLEVQHLLREGDVSAQGQHQAQQPRNPAASLPYFGWAVDADAAPGAGRETPLTLLERRISLCAIEVKEWSTALASILAPRPICVHLHAKSKLPRARTSSTR